MDRITGAILVVLYCFRVKVCKCVCGGISCREIDSRVYACEARDGDRVRILRVVIITVWIG